MNFSELESLMSSRGITSLAEIARSINTTPQAVSNWKARNQIPYHVIAKLNLMKTEDTGVTSISVLEEEHVLISDLLLTMAEQLKVIIIVPFITVFLTFTYVQFIQVPKYASETVIYLPAAISQTGGFGGLANQFGVSVPTANQNDLSHPSLFPELLRSHTFAEKVLDKEFFTKKYGKKLKLLSILTHGNKPTSAGKDTLVTKALSGFFSMITYSKSNESKFSKIRVVTLEPVFSRDLVLEILIELEKLNRFYKNQSVNEKINFIEQRIISVSVELENSEKQLKDFSEKNRQISSPSLVLEEEHLQRDVEVSKGVYMTLKQELELAKIEEVQKSSIVQIVDPPQIRLKDFNINLISSVVIAGVMGLTLGILIAFVRSYFKTDDIDDRKKFRRMKNFIKKKLKDLLLDNRVAGIISALFLLGLPIYLGRQSGNPEFFGMYSTPLMLVIIVYILILILFSGLFIYLTFIKK